MLRRQPAGPLPTQRGCGLFSPGVFEVRQSLLQISCDFVCQTLLLANTLQKTWMRILDEFQQSGFKASHVFNGNVVSITIAGGPDDEYLVFDVHWLILGLLQDFNQALTARELGLRRLVQIGSKLREGLQFPELSKINSQCSSDLFHRLDLG
jgi:hypothetical protein